MLKEATISMLAALMALIPACRQDVNTQLLEAAKSGQSEQVKSLLDAGADVKVRDNRGQTPLMIAAEEDQTQIVELLKQAGAKE